MDERWRGTERKVGEYARIGKERKGQKSKNAEGVGAGFLVAGYLCGTTKVIRDKK